MAGQSQSPWGILATTSTRPYLILAPTLVLMRPDFTGWTMVPLVVFVDVIQSDHTVEVHVPVAVRLMTLLVVMRVSFWRVGLMYSFPSWMKTFSSSPVVSSNWPFLHPMSVWKRRQSLPQNVTYPKPPTWTSLVQMEGFKTPDEKSSLRTEQ